MLIGTRAAGAALGVGAILGDRLTDGARDGVAGLMLRGVTDGAATGARLPEFQDREGTAGAADERFGALNPLEGDWEIRGAGAADRLKLGEGADCRFIEGAKERPADGLDDPRLNDGLDDPRLNDGLDERRLTDGADDRPPDREAPSASICNPANNSRHAQGIRRL